MARSASFSVTRTVFLAIGIDDLLSGGGADAVATDHARLVATIRARVSARPIVTSLLPVNDGMVARSDERLVMWQVEATWHAPHARVRGDACCSSPAEVCARGDRDAFSTAADVPNNMVRGTMPAMSDSTNEALTCLGRYAVKIDHIAIAVPNLEAAVAFYKQQLGFELIQQRLTTGDKTAMISAVLRAGAIIVVLVQGTTPQSQVNRFIANYSEGVQHVAIEVRNIEKARQDLAASGVEFATGLIEGRGIRQLFTARDRASGMMFEFIERETNDGDFTDESVQQLFNQLERNDAY